MDILSKMFDEVDEKLKDIIPRLIFTIPFLSTVTNSKDYKSRQAEDNIRRKLKIILNKYEDDDDNLMILSMAIINIVYKQTNPKLLEQLINFKINNDIHHPEVQ